MSGFEALSSVLLLVRPVLTRIFWPTKRPTRRVQHLAPIKIMIGDEDEKYFVDTHAKAKKYTEWAKNRQPM
jgi:hypothetical protein